MEKPGNFISPEKWEPCLCNDITEEVLKCLGGRDRLHEPIAAALAGRASDNTI